MTLILSQKIKMHKHKHIIVGLGWLGTPLAVHFLSAGDSVAGTTRNSDKATTLALKGIQTVLFDLYDNDVNTLPSDIFRNANVIINIPPGRKSFKPPLFIARMKSLFDYALLHQAKHICFISTTSVFGGLEGRISNDSVLKPNTPSGSAHVELELYLKELADTGDFSCSVLRLAGLVGKDRHPIATLSKKSNVTLGRNPVNLIHQQDVVQVISALLQKAGRKNQLSNSLQSANSMFEGNFYAANLCSAEHPTREDYYTWCADQKGIRGPEFTPDNREIVSGKWIDSEQTTTHLQVQLQYPSPYNMLE
jgi:nucleoside-diphosphate-sugar epimerase